MSATIKLTLSDYSVRERLEITPEILRKLVEGLR